MGEVVGRLAPSPTGRLHLGHARTFLAAWWSARSQGGRVVLRIEDLDEARVKPGATDLVLRDLEWLELDWDEPPMTQSKRTAEHRAALDDLVERGLAFPCVCTRREIEEAASAPHGDGAETPYPGTCEGRWSTIDEARSETGRDPALRLRVAPGDITFEDAVMGPVSFDVAAASGDFVVGRKDGVAAYQFATPFDDHAQGVTEVVRGDDLAPSAARQALVLDALGVPPETRPRHAHVPLVVGADGARLAKRAGSLSLEELRDVGVQARQIRHWAAATYGFADEDEAETAFRFGAGSKGPVRLAEDPVAALRRL